MKTICIYHGNCADGFGAAFVVWKAQRTAHWPADVSRSAPKLSPIGRDLVAGEVEFYPGVYQEAPPDVAGKRVLLVDFSYKRDVMLDIASRAHSIYVLDHHESAMQDLQGLEGTCPIYITFDMERSGAMIAWDFFFPDEEAPWLIKHIQDRDLFRFEYPDTRNIQANVFSYPYDFATWDRLMTEVQDSPEDFAQDGAAIERKHWKDLDELLPIVTRTMTIGGHRVPVANLPYTMASDAGNRLAQGQPFAACYWDTPTHRVFSLRSTDEGLNVQKIAVAYGGGGHAKSAGFRLTHEQAYKLELAG